MRFSEQCSRSYKTEEDADEGILRDVEAPSGAPGGLFSNRRLYRFSTDARFSFPLGNATSPAAVPVRPLRPDTAVSTSLMISRTVLAAVKGLLLSLSVDPRSTFCRDELKPLASSVDVSRQ